MSRALRELATKTKVPSAAPTDPCVGLGEQCAYDPYAGLEYEYEYEYEYEDEEDYYEYEYEGEYEYEYEFGGDNQTAPWDNQTAPWTAPWSLCCTKGLICVQSSVNVTDSFCEQTKAPTRSPTRSPTKRPTRRPTHAPTPKPSKPPTKKHRRGLDQA